MTVASAGGMHLAMSRTRELSFRIVNATLISALRKLHRRFGVSTTYKLNADGAEALFEGSWFAYNSRERGCTGNIDYVPDAENATRSALFARVKEGDILYDVGAHGGVYTVTLLKKFPNLVVHSFEPQPEELYTNLRLNDLPIDKVHPVALGERAGSVMMTTRRRSSNHVSEQGDRRVRMVKLEEYVSEKGLPLPDWIKIDIEGLELPALRGAENLLRESGATIICEINHLYDRFGTTLPEFFAFISSLGYKPFRLDGGNLVPVSGFSNFEMLGYSENWNFWFISTKRKSELETGNDL